MFAYAPISRTSLIILGVSIEVSIDAGPRYVLTQLEGVPARPR